MCPNPKMGDNMNNKSVKFDQVFIHEFPLIMGDNPAVSKGAPLTIDWKPLAHDVIDLDIYEYLREPERRHRKRMIMSTSKRAKILMNAGYSIDDIAETTLQVEDAKRIRAENALESANILTTTGAGWKNLNSNIMELLSGAAEGTGRTLFLAPNAMLGAATSTGQAVGKVGYEVARGTGKVVVGTGKVATDVVVGTGKLGYDVVVGTGKVATDVAVGTVKGTGKVVVGAGKAATGVVVGTGKLGFDVVKSTGRRVSKFLSMNDSSTKLFMETDDYGDSNLDLGYEDIEEGDEEESETRRQKGVSRAFNRHSSDHNLMARPAPQRMQRRGSANGSVAAQLATRRQGTAGGAGVSNQSPKPSKAKRRGSGNRGVASVSGSITNLTNILTGRGVRRSASSSSTKGNNRRSNSNDGGKKDRRRRRATMTHGGPQSPRHTKSANAVLTLRGSAVDGGAGGGGSSELAQMEQFLNYVRDSDPQTVNPVIDNAYASNSSLGYNHDSDGSRGSSSPIKRQNSRSRRQQNAVGSTCSPGVDDPVAVAPERRSSPTATVA